MPQAAIDTHVHFWDTTQYRYPWLTENQTLNHPFLPADFAAAATGIPVEKIVFVEAGGPAEQGLTEAAWVSELAAAEPRIQGIVAFAPLETGAAARDHLAQLGRYPLVKGVRRLIQAEGLDFCIQPDFVAGVQLLGQFDLSFDICIKHPQLPAAIELVRRCPQVSFILDHIGKPDIAAGLQDPWREQITALAAEPNVVCKISGLVTEADLENWTPAELQPYIDHIIAAFGAERVMYGSDWPVATLAAPYRRWFEALDRATANLSEAERHQLFYANAERVYRLAGS